MGSPLVSVIVLNYNGRKWLDACCQSLLATRYPNFRVLLVDNGSTDESVEFVRASFPSIDVIVNETNLGYSGGNNVGIEAALAHGTDYIVLVNPDTRVEPEWLEELIAVGEREESVGILGAVQLVYESNQLNSWTRSAFPELIDKLTSPSIDLRWIPVEWVEGACLAAKRKVFDEVGLLDPIYFAFYEEIDFCRRAARRGWKVALVVRSRIHHHRGGVWESSPQLKRKRDYTCDRSQFIYTLTEPRRTLTGNLGWYLITLGTKAKEALKPSSSVRVWDLLRMQVDVLRSFGAVREKWRRDRALTLSR